MKRSVGIALLLALAFAQRALAQDIPGASGLPQPAPREQAVVLGSIDGTVTFRGEIPKSPVGDDAGVHRDSLHVHPKSGGLQNVVVWLTGPVRPVAPAPSTNLPVALIDQRDHEFVPRVLAVRAGQPVKFSNSDAANHNVRTSSPQRTNEFNVFTGVDGFYTHHFVPESRQQPIRLGCDIHPWMHGWIYVFDHPYFSVTDDRGRFRIGSLAPGEYNLAIRQPDIGYASERRVLVKLGEATRLDLELSPKDVRVR